MTNVHDASCRHSLIQFLRAAGSPQGWRPGDSRHANVSGIWLGCISLILPVFQPWSFSFMFASLPERHCQPGRTTSPKLPSMSLGCTHRSFSIQMHLHRDSFTCRISSYTQMLLQERFLTTDNFIHISSYTERPLHREVFAHRQI